MWSSPLIAADLSGPEFESNVEQRRDLVPQLSASRKSSLFTSTGADDNYEAFGLAMGWISEQAHLKRQRHLQGILVALVRELHGARDLFQ